MIDAFRYGIIKCENIFLNGNKELSFVDSGLAIKLMIFALRVSCESLNKLRSRNCNSMRS